MPRTTAIALFGFCAMAVVLPLVHGELLPFTDAALFTDAQPTFAAYRVVDARGRRLDPKAFQLALVYNGLRGESLRYPKRGPGAIRRAVSSNRWGEVLSEQDVRALVEARLVKLGATRAVTVTQIVFGALDADRVGVIARNRWVIAPPRALPSNGVGP
jgi:hypothetical protein